MRELKWFDSALFIKVNIAGYGLFFRISRDSPEKQKCLTDEYGRNKFHTCSQDGRGEDVCLDSRPPESPTCKVRHRSGQWVLWAPPVRAAYALLHSTSVPNYCIQDVLSDIEENYGHGSLGFEKSVTVSNLIKSK